MARAIKSADHYEIKPGRLFWMVLNPRFKGQGIFRVRVTSIERHVYPSVRVDRKVYQVDPGFSWGGNCPYWTDRSTLYRSEEAARAAVDKYTTDRIAELERKIVATKTQLSARKRRFTTEKKRTRKK